MSNFKFDPKTVTVGESSGHHPCSFLCALANKLVISRKSYRIAAHLSDVFTGIFLKRPRSVTKLAVW